MIILTIPSAWIKLARLHFKNPDILSVRFTIQVILFYTGGNTFHKSFAAGNVECITVKYFFNRWFSTDLHIYIFLVFRQPFQPCHCLVFLLLRHKPVIFLKKFLPAEF